MKIAYDFLAVVRTGITFQENWRPPPKINVLFISKENEDTVSGCV